MQDVASHSFELPFKSALRVILFRVYQCSRLLPFKSLQEQATEEQDVVASNLSSQWLSSLAWKKHCKY